MGRGARPAAARLRLVVVAGAIVATAVQDLLWMQRPPELAPDRTVSEQDCTKPIQLSGNLRCR